MALSISDLTPEGRRYFEQLQKLSRLEVQVGFQEGQTYEDCTSLADVAAYNELGTSYSPAVHATELREPRARTESGL